MLLADLGAGMSALLLIVGLAVATPFLDRRRQRREFERIAAHEAAIDLSREEHVGTPVGEDWRPPLEPVCFLCRKRVPLPNRRSCHACGIAALRSLQGGFFDPQVAAPIDSCIVCRLREPMPDRHVCEPCSIMAVAKTQGVQ